MDPIQTCPKSVLITGKNSFIGQSFAGWAKEKYSGGIQTDAISMRGQEWKKISFSGYDTVLHVAGIAHVNLGRMTQEEKNTYFGVNRDLVIESAKKARTEGVKQFVFLSSVLVYGDSAPYGKAKRIRPMDTPAPTTVYGESKLKAEQGLLELETDDFHVAILRLPMVYGPGCKGNYPHLEKLARKLLIFPKVDNERSMLYIDNLSEFLCRIIMEDRKGIFYPQNREYVNTSELVRAIADAYGHRILISKVFNFLPALCSHIPGKIRLLNNKAFSSISYEKEMSQYDFEYQVTDLKTSVERMAEK